MTWSETGKVESAWIAGCRLAVRGAMCIFGGALLATPGVTQWATEESSLRSHMSLF
jgi:hypothetical protein